MLTVTDEIPSMFLTRAYRAIIFPDVVCDKFEQVPMQHTQNTGYAIISGRTVLLFVLKEKDFTLSFRDESNYRFVY